MMMCAECHEKIAVVFVNKYGKEDNNVKGYCLDCASKLGIDVESEIQNKMGISKEEFSKLNDQISDIFKDMDMEAFQEEMKMMMPDGDSEGNPMMNAFNQMVKGNNSSSKKEDKTDKNSKKYFGKKTKNLDKYGTNLTELAKKNKVDRVIGRNREIDRVIQILNRRSKNNPVLIGEPGVGKTAIAEGLAVRIIEKEVPEKIFNAQIYLLDLTSIVAGTQFTL